MNKHQAMRERKKEKLAITREMRLAGKTWTEVGVALGLSASAVKGWTTTFNREHPEVKAAICKAQSKQWEQGKELVLQALECCGTIHEALEYTGLKRSTFDMRLRAMREEGVMAIVPPGFYRDKDEPVLRDPLVIALDRRISTIRRRAAKKDLPFDLNRAWVRDICKRQNGKCFYTGWEMTIEDGSKLVTVDRIDSSKGYTKDNCVLACWAANCAKNTMGVAEFAELTLAMADRFKAAIARTQNKDAQ